MCKLNHTGQSMADNLYLNRGNVITHQRLLDNAENNADRGLPLTTDAATVTTIPTATIPLGLLLPMLPLPLPVPNVTEYRLSTSDTDTAALIDNLVANGSKWSRNFLAAVILECVTLESVFTGIGPDSRCTYSE